MRTLTPNKMGNHKTSINTMMVAWESKNWASNSNFIIIFIHHTQHLGMSSLSPDNIMLESKEFLNTENLKMQV